MAVGLALAGCGAPPDGVGAGAGPAPAAPDRAAAASAASEASPAPPAPRGPRRARRQPAAGLACHRRKRSRRGSSARSTREGLKFEVINAGVSGDTSAGGLRRLDWALDGDVRVLVVELGANDGLRGLPVDEMRRNLSTIIERAQARHITVVLCGMEAPPNFGRVLHDRVPRRLQGRRHASMTSRSCRSCSRVVAGLADLNQADGIHPNARGAQRKVADTVWSTASAAPRRTDRIALMIELRQVSRTVPSGGRALTILHPIDLTVSAGQRLAIVGPSGSGKSTLLGLMAGLDAPSTGTIIIDGVDITSLSEDALARLRGAKIGFVFQFFHLMPSLTAFENVLVPMELAGEAARGGARAGAAGGSRAVGSRASLSVAALGRRAAARRAGPRAGERAADSDGGRADRQSRQRQRPARHRSALGRATARAAPRSFWSPTIASWRPAPISRSC